MRFVGLLWRFGFFDVHFLEKSDPTRPDPTPPDPTRPDTTPPHPTDRRLTRRRMVDLRPWFWQFLALFGARLQRCFRQTGAESTVSGGGVKNPDFRFIKDLSL